jgi:hypothetical protein
MSMTKRYVIKIKSLDKNWHDMDDVLLHASFQILIDFVEGERPDRHIDWSHSKETRWVWREIKGLYRWWKKERPKRNSPLYYKALRRPPHRFEKIKGLNASRLIEPDKKTYAAYYRALNRHTYLEKRWLDEDRRCLHRLANIRPYLWT